MKIFDLILFLIFSLLTANDIYAGNNNLTASYPSPQGSYNKVSLNTQTGTNVDCTVSSNRGLLYLYTDPVTHNQSLELCANNGQSVKVPYPETCFNQFCSYQDPATTCTPSPCPPNYAQIAVNNGANTDTFTTTPTWHVLSSVCCTGSALTPPCSPVDGTCTTWGACSSSTCDVAGTQTCTASTAASCGGAPPPTTQACTGNTPVDGTCTAWGACSTTCGSGTQACTTSTAAQCGGTAAPASQACTDNSGCSSGPTGPTCTGGWTNCSVACGGGTQTYHDSPTGCSGGYDGTTMPCATDTVVGGTYVGCGEGCSPVGSTSDGVHTCQADHTWGPCSGYTLCCNDPAATQPSCSDPGMTRSCDYLGGEWEPCACPAGQWWTFLGCGPYSCGSAGTCPAGDHCAIHNAAPAGSACNDNSMSCAPDSGCVSCPTGEDAYYSGGAWSCSCPAGQYYSFLGCGPMACGSAGTCPAGDHCAIRNAAPAGSPCNDNSYGCAPDSGCH